MSGSKAISRFYEKKNLLLEKSLKNFIEVVGLSPKFGVELEFYLLGKNSQKLVDVGLVDDFISALQKKLDHNKAIYKIEKEQGFGQIEVKISHELELNLLCASVDEVRKAALELAREMGLHASFKSLPFIDDCPSAMQFNFSLHDKNGQNIFIENEKLFFSSIAAMLENVEFMMIFCAPNEEDYLRFDKKINLDLHKKGKYNAPTNICYGENNRTALVRIPGPQNGNKRIEFRLPSASSDQYLVLSGLLILLVHGLFRNIQLDESKKIFGNAFDIQYKLQEFAKNLKDAEKNFFSEENFLRNKMEKFLK